MIIADELNKILKIPLKINEPMSNYTSWKVGGPAEYYLIPSDTKELADVINLSQKHSLPIFFFGNGTNLLILDGGIKGLVVNIGQAFSYIEIKGSKVKAGAGTSLTHLARETANKGLRGLEFAAGIPGLLGGAVTMNAGAFGGHIGEKVNDIRLLNWQGREETLAKEVLQFGYRRSNLTGCGVIIEVSFLLERGNPAELQHKVEYFITERKKRHPGLPSAGSVFKNLSDVPAGRIIEDAGCKGMRIGGAEVSTHHANFIVNTGGASAKDILALIEQVQQIVKERFAVQLIPEVRITGEE